MNRRDLEKRVNAITGELIREKGHIAFVDVFMKLGYLNQADYEAWRNKRIPFLERVIRTNLGRINFIMKTVTKNSRNGKLRESFTAYHSWGKSTKSQLRFSKTGEKNIERAYATHFLVLPKPTEKKTGAEPAS